MSWSARPRGALRTLAQAMLALVLVLLAGWLGFSASVQRGTESLRQEANHQLELFGAAAEGIIKRLEHAPATVQLNQDVLALLRQPQSAARVDSANLYLRRLNAHLGSLSVFVLNERGTVLASSDATMAGEDQAFRPYFLEALSGRVGRHFAIDTRNQQPGYYVSHPIHDGARVAGVAAIKISLEAINEAWPSLGSPALLADSNQVVILSSEPGWRYTALAELSVSQRVDLQLSRLYGEQRLPRFPLKVDLRIDENSQVVEGMVPHGPDADAGLPLPASRGLLVQGRTLNGMDWRLLMFSDLQPVRREAVMHSLLAALAAGTLLLLALIALQRRRLVRQKLQAQRWLQQANTELEHTVQRRTSALTEANLRLKREVAERQQAETTLRQAQDELVHAGKMAVLGQLAASITHELTQPLGGIRTLAGNAAEFMRRGNHAAAQDNLSIVARLVEQMARIIDPLKSFSRKSSASPGSTDVGRVIEQALFLFQLRLRHDDIRVDNRCEPGRWTGWCDANRLEQVLVNLIGNAMDAMRESPERVLTLTAERQDGAGPSMIALQVRDSGKGLSETDLQRLFEPFYTTKPSGVGLGLGLAICRDLVAEFGGELQAHNHPEGGACFVLTVPVEAPDDIPKDTPSR